MHSLITQRRLTLAVLVSVPVVAVLLLGWFALRSPRSRFLPSDGPAQWIVYPVPPRVPIVLGGIEQHAVFRGSVDLAEAPASARLRVRGFSDCTVEINGRPIILPAVAQWKQVRAADVGEYLHVGTNEIRALVKNDIGPPALWLAIDGPGWSVASDDRWSVSLDGAIECPAHPAREQLPLRPGNPVADDIQSVESLKSKLPVVLVGTLVSAVVLLLAYAAARHKVPLQLLGFGLSPVGAGLLAASVLWMLLFSHNTYQVPLFPLGFDSAYHLKYIQYILDNKTIPLADDGWQMHHPPLFHLLAAGLLWACRLSTQDPGALVIFRLMGLAAGLGELALVAASMRLLFPAKPGLQLAGLALAAFLPAPIYMCHYITNEPLGMLLGTAAVYCCLRVLHDERPTASQYALLGCCLGLAQLAKLTNLVVTGVVLLVLAGNLVARRERNVLNWLSSLGLTSLTTFLVCGWYYARVWEHFGTPFVGNFDPISGYHWWEYPGYATPAYLFGFGHSLVHPFYSALHSLPDGWYSTLWCDGLCAGMDRRRYGPPWNDDLMAASSLLALVPTFLIVLGLVAALVQLVRRPRAEWYLLLGIAGGLATATYYQLLRYPYNGLAKAFFELSGMITFCALGALGMDLAGRMGRVVSALLAILLGTWACSAYASLWIEPGSAATQNWAGLQYLLMNRYADADLSFRRALKADPHSVSARLSLAVAGMQARGQITDQARKLIEDVLHDHPDNPDALWGMALFLQTEGRMDEALENLQRASVLAPDHPLVYSHMGAIYMRQARFPEAITAYRQALRITPDYAPADHANLGLLLAQTGQIEEAVAQYQQALRLRPDQALWSADLARIRATPGQGKPLNAPAALRTTPYALVLPRAIDEPLRGK